MNRRTLIGNVRVRKTSVYVGEPLAVKVVTVHAKKDESIEVSINGVPGKSQYLQFTHPGQQKIFVVASIDKKHSDLRVVGVDVQPRPSERDRKSLFPIIVARQNFHINNGATLRLANTDEFVGKEVYYVWDIGGVQFTSVKPQLDYSFEDRLDKNKPHTSFHIMLHVKTLNNREVYTGKRTISVWNTYYLNKQRGFIQLPVDSENYARREGGNYTGNFTIKNIEPEQVQFTSVQIEYLYNDPEKAIKPERPKDYEWKIGARGTIKKDFSIPAKRFPGDAFGYALHFRGKTRKNLMMFADVYFEVKTNALMRRRVEDPEIISILDDLRSSKISLRPDEISIEQLTEYVTASTECHPRIISGSMRERMGVDWLNKNISKIIGDINAVTRALKDDLEGVECTPEDEDNPPEGYACQLTNEWRWEIIPARILNARKGDVLLSPGGNGPIGGLLRQVSPPQLYSHSGIMINNYYRLKHSTASTKLLEDSAGKDGFDPDILKYVWPGTIEQSIEEAFNGSYLDYDSKEYRISGFDNETGYVENIGIIEPLVVKPDPLVEAELFQVRETLHRVAESTKEIHGHYRFYCYTNADIFFDDSYKAPDKGSGWWASNSRPTVCSTLIWAAIKRLEEPIPMLEGREAFTQPSDLEATDVGAEVDLQTRDGLYYYTENERAVATHWLYNYFYDLAYGVAGFWGTLLYDIPDELANQICNTFIFDWSGEDNSGNHAKDSDRWKNPGDGRAVSPDNIENYWDAPTLENDLVHGLYGYSEKLIYRPTRLEFRRVSRLARVDQKTTLSGNVLYKGNTVAGAVVKVAGLSQLTDNNGEFEFTVPTGLYRVDASKIISGWFMSAQQDVTLSVGEDKVITLILEEPDEMFREITVCGSIYIVDDEWGDDETARRSVFMSGIRIGPFDTYAERSQTEKMGGEVRVEMKLKLDWQLDVSVNVWYQLKLYEGTSEETNDLEDTKTGTINVPNDQTIPLTLRLVNTEFDGGDTADINLQIINDRQP